MLLLEQYSCGIPSMHASLEAQMQQVHWMLAYQNQLTQEKSDEVSPSDCKSMFSLCSVHISACYFLKSNRQSLSSP